MSENQVKRIEMVAARRESEAVTNLASWLEFLGISDCPCPYEYRSLGRLYGISMGKGWVRMDTDPICPHHEK